MENNPDLVKFRTSVGGFNRADVIRYIELANLQAQREKKDLEDRAAQLSRDVDALREEAALLRQEAERLREENRSLQKALDDCTAPEPEPLPEPPEAPEALSAPPEEDQPAAPSLPVKELCAYRRAEAVERLARKRATELYFQVASIQQDALTKLDDISGEASALYADISDNMERMREALADLHVLFNETEVSLRQLELPAETDLESEAD